MKLKYIETDGIQGNWQGSMEVPCMKDWQWLYFGSENFEREKWE